MKLLNTQQKERLKAIIEVEPGLRTVQLVDLIDADFEAVEDALQTLIDAGAVVAHKIMGPNGRQANAYTLKGVPLPEKVGPIGSVLNQVPAAPPEIPVFVARYPDPPHTKVGAALAFLKQNRTASSEELAACLGLTRTALLKTYLRDPLAKGTIKKVRDTWYLGDGTPPKPEAKEEKTQSQVQVAVTSTDNWKILEDAPPPPPVMLELPPQVDVDNHQDCSTIQTHTAALQPIAQPTDSIPSVPLFGVWSDGSLHIARKGEPTVILSAHEVHLMHSHYSKVHPIA